MFMTYCILLPLLVAGECLFTQLEECIGHLLGHRCQNPGRAATSFYVARHSKFYASTSFFLLNVLCSGLNNKVHPNCLNCRDLFMWLYV